MRNIDGKPKETNDEKEAKSGSARRRRKPTRFAQWPMEVVAEYAARTGHTLEEAAHGFNKAAAILEQGPDIDSDQAPGPGEDQEKPE